MKYVMSAGLFKNILTSNRRIRSNWGSLRFRFACRRRCFLWRSHWRGNHIPQLPVEGHNVPDLLVGERTLERSHPSLAVLYGVKHLIRCEARDIRVGERLDFEHFGNGSFGCSGRAMAPRALGFVERFADGLGKAHGTGQ
jgi:hypothetical protein